MDLRNCPECGKVFVWVAHNLCPECAGKEEAFFKEVEKYLELHPGATIFEISEATGVPEEKIISFLRAGRLIPLGGGMLLECEHCGKPIASGRFCDACRVALSSSFKERVSSESRAGVQKQDVPLVQNTEARRREKARMYTAERYRRTRR